MKRVEITLEDDQVGPYLAAVAALPKPVNSLKVEPMRVRASRAKGAQQQPENGNGQQS